LFEKFEQQILFLKEKTIYQVGRKHKNVLYSLYVGQAQYWKDSTMCNDHGFVETKSNKREIIGIWSNTTAILCLNNFYSFKLGLRPLILFEIQKI